MAQGERMHQGGERGRNDAGYTLTELMVVVAIIGVLLAIALAVYVPATAAAAAAACRSNQMVLDQASVIAHCTSGVPAPLTLEDLRPYARNFDMIIACPKDDTPLVYNELTGDVSCPNHP